MGVSAHNSGQEVGRALVHARNRTCYLVSTIAQIRVEMSIGLAHQVPGQPAQVAGQSGAG